MQLLKEIKDKGFSGDESSLRVRDASRAVLFDENGLIPLLFVSERNYHKLPGGGIKDGEDKVKALVREVLEEVGSEIELTAEIGKIVEFRSKENLKQTSYCYMGKVISKGDPDFTKKELSQGFKLVWLSLDKAISKVKNDKPQNYDGSLIQKRDIVFLKKAKQIKASLK